MVPPKPTTTPDNFHELTRLTERLIAYRVMRAFYSETGLSMADLTKMKPLPPLEGIAGLGNIFKDAAKAIEEVKTSSRSLGTEAAALASDIQTVREHVRREHEDFHFKLSTLGNGGGNASDETKKETTGSQDSSESFQQHESKTGG